MVRMVPIASSIAARMLPVCQAVSAATPAAMMLGVSALTTVETLGGDWVTREREHDPVLPLALLTL